MGGRACLINDINLDQITSSMFKWKILKWEPNSGFMQICVYRHQISKLFLNWIVLPKLSLILKKCKVSILRK